MSNNVYFQQSDNYNRLLILPMINKINDVKTGIVQKLRNNTNEKVSHTERNTTTIGLYFFS